MTKFEIEKLAASAQDEADREADAALEQADQIEGVLRKTSDVQMIHTAKAERRMRERMAQEGGHDLEDEDENMSAAEKRALDAERRQAWRQARLKSLENDAIQAQLVIQKMSELNVTSGEVVNKEESTLTSIGEVNQPLYANVEDEDNANKAASDSLNNVSMPVSWNYIIK